MAETESLYVNVRVGEDGNEFQELQPAAHLNASNVGTVRFAFNAPADITDSLKKKQQMGGDQPAQSGRLAYASATVMYPDKTTSYTAAISQLIIQHRPGAKDKYGIDYLSVGIPESIIDKILADAITSKVSVTLPPTAKRNAGYCWMTAKLDKVPGKRCTVLMGKDGEHSTLDMEILEALTGMGRNMTGIMVGTVSASYRTADLDARIDLERVTYNLAFKPTEVYMMRATDITGPTIELGRLKERIALSEDMVADDALVRLALSRLNIAAP